MQSCQSSLQVVGQGRIRHSSSLPQLHMSNINACQLELSLPFCCDNSCLCPFVVKTALSLICRKLCWTLSLRNTCAGPLSQSSQSHSYHSTGRCKLQSSNSLPSRSQPSPPPLLVIPTATQTHQIGIVNTRPRCLTCQIRLPQMNILARARPNALVIKTQTGLIRAPPCSRHQAHHNSLTRTCQGSLVRTNSRCLIRIQEECLIRTCYSPCSGAPHSRSQTPPAHLM